MKIGYINAERRSNRACCQCTGTYFTQNSYSEVRSEDQKRIAELRGFLYDTKPENIDFNRIAEVCNVLYKKYDAIP